MHFNIIPITNVKAFTIASPLVMLFATIVVCSSEVCAKPLSTVSSPFSRPVDWSPYRPAVHLTPNKHWMNDPQRPILIDGIWHYYYLYNADYPNGNGTEWYHMTSKDLVHWQEHGVAINKYKNGLGDIQTGSAVIDTNNTAGFGAGAIIAIMTQQHEGVQVQSLFVSIDGGYHFNAYNDNPVMDNPGAEHWRDPKIIWEEENKEWLMVLAEGDKIGFYTSPDLKHWTYQSNFQRDDLGLLECPDLFRLSRDGNPNDTRWVLASGANGFKTGRTTGTVYWIGSWDGKRFIPENNEPQWLDSGADFYAMVSWDDPRLDTKHRLASRYAIGWLNNWAYAHKLPTKEWHGATTSIVRQIELRTVHGKSVIFSKPIDAFDKLEGSAKNLSAIQVTNSSRSILPQPESDAYRVKVELDVDSDATEIRFRLKEKDEHYAIIGYNFKNETVFVRRDKDIISDFMPKEYSEERKSVARAHLGTVKLDIIVDTFSVEVFANDGETVLSNLVFGYPGANKLSVVSIGGTANIRSFQLTPLKVAPIKRDSRKVLSK